MKHEKDKSIKPPFEPTPDELARLKRYVKERGIDESSISARRRTSLLKDMRSTDDYIALSMAIIGRRPPTK